MLAADPRKRFWKRVDDYAGCRPGGPSAVLELLRDHRDLFTQLFCANGNLVYAIEPNAGMRGTGERFLPAYPRFRTVAGSAEATTLPPAAADILVTGQPFHSSGRKAGLRSAILALGTG